MKNKFLGFSLVELMISLITISLITAALAPVITKKLSAGTITVGSFGGGMAQEDSTYKEYKYEFLEPGENTWQVPDGVKEIEVTLVSGGAGGGGGTSITKTQTFVKSGTGGMTADENNIVTQFSSAVGTWNVPDIFDGKISVTGCGGGGGGAGGKYNTTSIGGGTGSYIVNKIAIIQPKEIATIYIGGGGGAGGGEDSPNAKNGDSYGGGGGGQECASDSCGVKAGSSPGGAGGKCNMNSSSCTKAKSANDQSLVADAKTSGGYGGQYGGGGGGGATAGGGGGGGGASAIIQNGEDIINIGGGAGGSADGGGGGGGGNGGTLPHSPDAIFAQGGTGGANATTSEGASISTIFGASYCNGGKAGGVHSSYAPAGSNGKPGALRITYVTPNISASGGGAGKIVPEQKISVTPKDTLKIYVGRGGAGGKGAHIADDGTIQSATLGEDGEDSYIQTSAGTVLITTAVALGAKGGSYTGEIYDNTTSPYYGAGGSISNGKSEGNFAATYTHYRSENGKTAGNGTKTGAQTFSAGTVGGDGGGTIINEETLHCKGGSGGTSSDNNGKDATGYGGCGGGGGYGASDGGAGTHGYVIIKYLKNEKCTIANCALCNADGKCGACDTGYSVNSVGICEACSAGTYYEDGSCKTCPAGYSCPDGTSKNKCADGTYTENEGESTCYDCPAGSYCTNGERALCAAGSYSEAKATECSVCPAGKYNLSNGQSSCTTCEAGYYCAGGSSHVACSSGTYSLVEGASEASTCTSCPAGYYCTGGANRSACANGSYSTGGASACSTSTSVDKCATYLTTSDGCSSCDTNYELNGARCMWSQCTLANGLFKVTADLGSGTKTYCVTQRNIGDHDNYRLPATNSTYLYGIYNAGSGDSACSANYTTGCCWQGATSGTNCDSTNGSYSGCNRTVCNWYAANGLCENINILGQTGWRLPTKTELGNLNPATYSKVGTSYAGDDGLMFCDYNANYNSARCSLAGVCPGSYIGDCNPYYVWSRTLDGSTNAVYRRLNSGSWYNTSKYRTNACSIRCIKEL